MCAWIVHRLVLHNLCRMSREGWCWQLLTSNSYICHHKDLWICAVISVWQLCRVWAMSIWIEAQHRLYRCQVCTANYCIVKYCIAFQCQDSKFFMGALDIWKPLIVYNIMSCLIRHISWCSVLILELIHNRYANSMLILDGTITEWFFFKIQSEVRFNSRVVVYCLCLICLSIYFTTFLHVFCIIASGKCNYICCLHNANDMNLFCPSLMKPKRMLDVHVSWWSLSTSV